MNSILVMYEFLAFFTDLKTPVITADVEMDLY